MGIWFAHEWKIPRIFIGLLVLELPLTVLNLVLMGVADPNTYRTRLWQAGANAGFNSDPSIILYSYANYKPLDPPLVWSQYMTTFNVVISVLSMFILLVKSAMFTMHFFYPALSVVVHAALIGLYAASLYNQTSGDYLDPAHPSPRPWFLTKSCSQYAGPGNYGYCLQARASVATVAVMMIMFIGYFGYSVWCSFPTEEEKAERETERLATLEMRKLSKFETNEYEMDSKNIFLNLPKTPATPGFGALNPMTPRTKAFSRLNGDKAPQVTTTTTSPTTSPSSSRALPFREQYGSSSAN